MENEALSILSAIAAKFGLQWGGLMAGALTIVALANGLKAVQPFAKWVNNSRVPYVVAGLSLISGVASYWGSWIQAAVASVLMTVLAISGWATAKMIAHKVGTPASNASGGSKPTA